ncbi:peptidase [Mesorhizobium sp. L2C066B000]|nr:peptidase [Mesorhizobium sp. L2C066B000]
MVRQALRRAAGPARSQVRLLVVIDQLEELFTTEKQPAMREALVRFMAVLAASGLVWVIAAIRSDFFHRCGEVQGLSALKDGLASYELLPPTGPEIAQMIREPAVVAGLRFEESAELGRLDDVLQAAATADPGSLPLLEFVLDALYQASGDRRVLTFAHYHALGGLEGAIARRADEVLDLLAPGIQEALPAVLRALTTANLGDETVTARAALYTEVAGTPARSALVRALIDARLLVSDEDAAGHVFVRLAHEALLSRWPRAGDIVNANRDFLATRERLRADAHRWHLESRNRELLLPSGKRLAEGEELMLSRRQEVDDAVLEYIEESLRAHRQKEEKDRRAELALIEAAQEAKRERLEREAERRSLAAAAANRLARRTRNGAVVAIMLALMAGAGALVAFKAREEARGQRDQALRKQFLSLSFLSERSAAAGNTEAAIRLALEALPSKEQPERPYLFEAEAALFKALLAHRQIKILRPGAGVAHAAFSPTGDRIVTTSYDKTAAVWDISSGAETAILKGHEGPVERAEFSPDGSRILTAARDGTARLWDAVSGEQLYILRPVGNYPTAIFSPDGTRVLTAGENSDATLWDAWTGKKVLGVSSDAYTRAAFSSDGRSFATAGKHFISIWNTADGVLTRSIRVTSWPYTLAFIGIIFLLHPWLGFFALGCSLLLIAMAVLTEYLVRSPLKQANDLATTNYNFTEMSLRNSEVVRAMGMIDGLIRRWGRDRNLALRRQAEASDRAALMSGLIRFLRLTMQSLILGLGAYLVIERQITGGTMFAASLLLGRGLQPVEQIVGLWRSLILARAALARVEKLVDGGALNERSFNLPKPTGKISVEQVSFAIASQQKVLLRDVSFRLDAGEALGIVGPSGAGKSTLARHLAGVMQPSRGTVRLDGADLSQWGHDALGDHIGYLPQDIELFADTVAANIGRFKTNVDQEVIAAARLAGVHEMIIRLPQGYETQIGEGGAVLSGGYRQRIALARAVFGTPNLIILDEPSSNLDADGDRALSECAIELKRRGSTVIIVSHRPSTLANVDKILLLRDGAVEAFGMRNEIVALLNQRAAPMAVATQ